MVTARSTGSKADNLKTHFYDYLNEFGTTVTLKSRTETLDSMGRVTSVTETSSSIKADIQWITKADLAHINIGEVRIGDGMLFVKPDVTINIEDELVFNSTRWRIVSQIEGEQVNGTVIYKGYIIRKNQDA